MIAPSTVKNLTVASHQINPVNSRSSSCVLFETAQGIVKFLSGRGSGFRGVSRSAASLRSNLFVS